MRPGTIIGMIIAIVLVTALWYFTRPSHQGPMDDGAPAAPAIPDTATADALIDQALRQAPDSDSTLIKSRWMDEVKNVDLAGVEGERWEIFLRHANARRCTCGCGFTLAACRTFDPTCPVSGPILEALRDSVSAGRIRTAEGLRRRPTPDAAPGG